ncbi:hypothetical protein N7465_001967 [Penicillium sp. CMV-2018d]|nr:hypothetical protein N7465_001967 [Penicillium sp. CMV-2018d]
MSRPGDFDNLSGTEVRLDHPSTLPAKTFILDEKLSEEYQTITQLECDQGLGPPFAAIKFSCHNLVNPAQQGFMRIYCQIPIDGTVSRPPEVRARQAVSQHTHAEIRVLKNLDDQNCAAVPRLLGLRTGLQDVGDYVPGGYISYVAWERVPGDLIKSRSFWESGFAYREQVRSAFSTAYEELRRCGWRPALIHVGKLIYNDVTKVMYISGFRDPVTIKPEPLSDVTYACWGLAKPSDRLDWYLDSSDWKW